VILWCGSEFAFSLLIGRRLPALRKLLRRSEARLRTSFEDIERLEKAGLASCLEDLEMHVRALDARLVRMRALYSRTFFHLLLLSAWKNTYRQTYGFGTLIAGVLLLERGLIEAGIFFETTNVLNETHRALSVVSDSWGIVTEIVAIFQRLREVEAIALSHPKIRYIDYNI
jgi:ABC-type long-subunit fatty acid transport system fused permease/ATPase subunit